MSLLLSDSLGPCYNALAITNNYLGSMHLFLSMGYSSPFLNLVCLDLTSLLVYPKLNLYSSFIYITTHMWPNLKWLL